MSSPLYPSVISILPTSANIASAHLSDIDDQSSASDGDSDRSDSVDEDMYNSLVNETKTKPNPAIDPIDHIDPIDPIDPIEHEPVTQRRQRQRRPTRPRLKNTRPRPRPRFVGSVDRQMERTRNARSARINRARGSVSRSNSVSSYESDSHDRPSPARLTESRPQKIVRIESNLVALRLDTVNLDALSEAGLNELDEKLKAQSARENMLKMARQCMIIFCVLIERAHTEFNPSNKHLLEGWSGQVFQSVCKCEYDHHLLAIYDYYSPSAVLHPVLALTLALGGSASIYAITRYFMENGLEAMRDFVSTPNFARDIRHSFAPRPERPEHTSDPPPPPAQAPAPAQPSFSTSRFAAPSASGNPMIDAIGSVMRNPGGLQPMISSFVNMMGRANPVQFAQPGSIGSTVSQGQSESVPIQIGSMTPPPAMLAAPPPPSAPLPPPMLPSGNTVLQSLQQEEDLHFNEMTDESPVPETQDDTGVLSITI